MALCEETKFLKQVQKRKMKELWGNKHDEAWEKT